MRSERHLTSRCRGDRGSGVVTGLVLIFAFTFLGLVWLARDVDRSVSNRTAAQSIAFQAARSGAQEVSVAGLRSGGEPRVDAPAARSAAERTAARLFNSYDLHGRIQTVDVEADRVTVTVTITDAGRTVSGTGTVRAERVP